MFLKRITLCGFKSFCDKVDFEFGPGVTCIVGPNGCGKSNVVDAFKWVLGEQSARSLRGRQMSDMIFNGSSTRRSSSVARVDLMFDNTDRTLALDHDEVTVTRKLYRSGESEYQINGDIGRLKDIRELFMDTGVGVDAYSVVEQGRVDSLLQSSPTDRRTIFEEAAGISKYKARRKEAERKLDRTQQNLLRVSDVIEELQKRIRSVKLAAGKARKFKEHEARLNELRSGFSLAEYHRFTQKIDGLTRESRDRGDRVTAVRTEIDRHEADEAELTSQLDHLAEEINAADSRFIQAKSELLAQEERIEAGVKRAEEQQVLLERARERHATDTGRMEDGQRELAAAEESIVALDEEMKSLAARLDELTEQDRSLARECTGAQSGLNDEKAGIIELLRRGARMHNEIVRLNTHREALVGQKGRLSERDALVGAELLTTLEKKAQWELRSRELEALIADQTTTLDEKEREASSHAAYRQQLAQELGTARENRTAMESRRELLADLESRMEGVGVAAQRLLDQRKLPDASAGIQSLVGMVADLFETDVEHAPVIEAALGDAAQQLVVTKGEALLGDDGTFADLPGRLTVLCLDRLRPIVHDRGFSDQPGFVARAIDFVRHADDLDHLALHLFGKTIVVESLDAAFAMAEGDVSGHRFVTLDGQVVEPDGRVTIGTMSAAAGLISRKSELRDLGRRISEVDETIISLDDQVTRADAETEHLVGVQRQLRTALQEATSSRAEAKAALEGVVVTVNRLTHEQPVIAQEVTLIAQQINEALEKSEEEGRSLEAVERENTEREERTEARQTEIDRLVEARRELQEGLTQARVAVGQLSEKRNAVRETINVLRRTLEALGQAIATAAHDIEHCEARIVEARESAEQGRRRLAEMAGQIQALEQKCNELRRSRDDLRERSEQLIQAVKAARTQLEAAEAEHHALEMSLTETRVHREDLIRRVSEEVGIDLAERYADYEHQDQDWKAVEDEITELRRKMDRLGNVNLDAIQELEEIETREAFLTGQHDDLTESRRQLDQLINQLNDESRERFQKAFTQIRDHFRSLFRKLFGGGRADIILENPDDVLESGIEIFAQPPGKDLQVISLMSGGEKSLTAIALLMSIFSIRPAPFAIMDEVDAALDEANNERFNQIIKEFVSQAQFLIITHSKWTMNIADRLYGITMQEPGVSTRVSVEFKGVSAA